MTITNVEVHDSNITFSLSGDMSVGSAPIVSLLIRRSQKMGLSVHLDVSGITELDVELIRYLSEWRAEGVILSGGGDFPFHAEHTPPAPEACRSL